MNHLQAYLGLHRLEQWSQKHKNAEGNQGKKSVIYDQAIKLFQSSRLQSNYTVKQLKEVGHFVLKKDSKPKYFQNEFNWRKGTITCASTKRYYDYKPLSPQTHSEYWVDFANARLGGGAFGSGFVQEEIMVAEMPELANHIAHHLRGTHSTINTRYGKRGSSHQVKNGSPSPIVFEGITRVQKVKGVYGRAIDEVQDIKKHLEPIAPQRVNVLAIAAPFLRDKSEGSKLDTIEDLFNTAVAGFATAKSATPDRKRTLIHTGPLGAGCFNNNAHVVYVVQKIAAQHLDVDIQFHGYDQQTVTEAEEDYQTILAIRDAHPDQSIQQLLKFTSNVMEHRVNAPNNK